MLAQARGLCRRRRRSSRSGRARNRGRGSGTSAIRVGVKEFVLAVYRFEVGHADAGSADGHAPREQFPEQILGCGE